MAGPDHWCRELILIAPDIGEVTSDDPDYQHDQDGINYSVPDDPTRSSGKKESVLEVSGGRFRNCWGRSVKTQVERTIVRNARFSRTSGFSSGAGNTEIDAQAGSNSVTSNNFDYEGGHQPEVVARVSCDLVAAKSALTVHDNEVHLDDDTTLNTFAQSYASIGAASTVDVSNNRVFGKVKVPVDYAVNGTKNVAIVRGNRFSKIVASDLTGDKALVYVRLAGPSGEATVVIENNTYTGGDIVYVGRDQVPGAGISAIFSAVNNPGSADDKAAAAKTGNLVTRQAGIVGMVQSAGTSAVQGGYRIETPVINDGATVAMPVRKTQGGAFIIAMAGVAGNGDNLIGFSSTNFVNTKWFGNSAFVLGGTSEPGTGDFRIWSSATNEISVKNASDSQAPICLFIMSNG